MGWGSGAELAVDVANAVRRGVESSKIREQDRMDLRKKILTDIVESFTASDWDTHHDAYGNDDALDAVLVELGHVSDEEEDEDDDEDHEEALAKLGAKVDDLEKENARLKEHTSSLKADLKEAAGTKAVLQAEWREDRERQKFVVAENTIFRTLAGIPYAKKLEAAELDALRNDGFLADKWMRVFAMRLGLKHEKEISTEAIAKAIDAALVGKMTGT